MHNGTGMKRQYIELDQQTSIKLDHDNEDARHLKKKVVDLERENGRLQKQNSFLIEALKLQDPFEVKRAHMQ